MGIVDSWMDENYFDHLFAIQWVHGWMDVETNGLIDRGWGGCDFIELIVIVIAKKDGSL